MTSLIQLLFAAVVVVVVVVIAYEGDLHMCVRTHSERKGLRGTVLLTLLVEVLLCCRGYEHFVGSCAHARHFGYCFECLSVFGRRSGAGQDTCVLYMFECAYSVWRIFVHSCVCIETSF